MQIRAIAFVTVLAAAAGLASAQVHVEAGDAGQLAGGQGTGNGALTAIRGVLDGAVDVDMYQIRVDDWAAFSATTTANAELPAPVESDTQLFLFSSSGMGIAFNDDIANGALSTLPIGHELYAGRTNGEIVWLAISGYNIDPTSGGGLIWTNTPFTGVRTPNGPGAASPVDGWTGENLAPRGSYRITLTGASAVPAPGAMALLGLGGIAAGRRRR